MPKQVNVVDKPLWVARNERKLELEKADTVSLARSKQANERGRKALEVQIMLRSLVRC
jgi:hypothetical protein